MDKDLHGVYAGRYNSTARAVNGVGVCIYNPATGGAGFRGYCPYRNALYSRLLKYSTIRPAGNSISVTSASSCPVRSIR